MASSPALPNTTTWSPAVGPGVTLVGFTFAFLPLPVIAVALRLWARKIKRKKLEFNDWAAVAGAILAVANYGIIIAAVYNGGVGHHVPDLLMNHPLMWVPLQKMVLALALTWTLANTAVKFSILHLYIVIFRKREFVWACYATMGLTVAYCLSNCLQSLLLCRPIQFNWDKTIDGVCSPAYYPYISSASIHTGIDLIIIILPMPMLWGLQMAIRKKISLTLAFGVGILICAMSIARIYAIATMDFNDFSYTVVSDGIFSALEPCLGVVNTCLPVLQPVALKISQRFISLTSRSDYTDMRGGASVAHRFNRGSNNKSQNSEVYPLKSSTSLEAAPKGSGIIVTSNFDVESHGAPQDW